MLAWEHANNKQAMTSEGGRRASKASNHNGTSFHAAWPDQEGKVVAMAAVVVIVILVALFGLTETVLMFFALSLGFGAAMQSEPVQETTSTIGDTFEWTFETGLPNLIAGILFTGVFVLHCWVVYHWLHGSGNFLRNPMARLILIPLVSAVGPLAVLLLEIPNPSMAAVAYMLAMYGCTLLLLLVAELVHFSDFYRLWAMQKRGLAPKDGTVSRMPAPPPVLMPSRSASARRASNPTMTRPLPPVPPPPAR